MLIQNWDETINPKSDDYSIFIVVSENSGKDNLGDDFSKGVILIKILCQKLG
ncbi:hypothetical protein KAJ41_01895 [Candidatus Parcubacteria bacterium]|nr:hypothetical protein [Candidatus Parcubacteria bacterium]